MSETFERVEGNPFQDAALPQQPIVGVPLGIEPLPVSNRANWRAIPSWIKFCKQS
jgi:hypothetical protein